MDHMKEALKKHMSKKGGQLAPQAEDPTHKFGKDSLDEDGPKKEKDLGDRAPMLPQHGDAVMPQAMLGESAGHEMHEEGLLSKILQALMHSSDHTGRMGMSLHEKAADAAKQKFASAPNLKKDM